MARMGSHYVAANLELSAACYIYAGETPADVRLLALKYWGEMANAPP